MLRSFFSISGVFILLGLVLLGCSSSEGESEDKTGAADSDEKEIEVEEITVDEPTTVKMLIAVDEETFNKRYKNQIEAKFPNITLELVPGDPANSDYLQELYAKGEMPDIIPVKPSLELVEELETLAPIDDYIQKTDFDLSVFRDEVIENLRAHDPLGEGHLYGLPIESTLMTMFYNKDIFDLFGEPYPTDGMTWKEALEVARRLTAEQGGVQYKGLQLSRTNAIPYTQLSVPGTDPETGEVLFASHPDTKRAFELLDELRNIPNMMDNDPDHPDGFYHGKKNIAMWVDNAPFVPILDEVEGLNFDLVTTPTWEDIPNVAPTSIALSFNITAYSENKDAAWLVISHLASEEGQIELSRFGSAPTIASDLAYEQFSAADVEEENHNYHVKAPFIDQVAKLAPYSQYDPEITFHGEDYISKKAREFLTSDQDVVTYLREMEEEYTGIVKEIKAQK